MLPTFRTLLTLHLSSLRPDPGGSVIPFFGTQTLVVWAGMENPDISISTVCSHWTPGSRSVDAGGAAAANAGTRSSADRRTAAFMDSPLKRARS